MSKNLRYFFVFMACITVILAIGACNKESSKETLKVYNYLDLADDTATHNFDALTAKFKELHPDVNLEFDSLVNEPYHNKLQAMNIANQLPDIIFLWPGQRTGQVTGSGKIKDLRPWLKSHMDEFAPAALAAQGPNGEIYELPQAITVTHVMFTNELLLKKLGLAFPKTLNELLAQGKIIRDAGYIPIAMDNKDGWEMQSTLLSALVERTGGRKWLENASTGQASFTDQVFVDALQVIKTLSDAQMFSPGINQAEYGRALTDFVKGKAVYFIDGGWRTDQLKTEASEELQKNISLHVFPALPNERGQAGSTAVVAGTGYGMNENLTEKDAESAWKWIWFVSGPEGSKITLQNGTIPAYKIYLPTDAALLTKRLAAFIGSTPGGYVLDNLMAQEGVVSVLQTGMQEMMFGNMSPKAVAAAYEKWVDANDSGRK